MCMSRKPYLAFCFGALLLAADLASKYLVTLYLKTASLTVLKGFFSLSLSYNTGVAFSIPLPNRLMLVLAPLLLGIIIFYMKKYAKMNHLLTQMVIALLVAGGLGNLKALVSALAE